MKPPFRPAAVPAPFLEYACCKRLCCWLNGVRCAGFSFVAEYNCRFPVCGKFLEFTCRLLYRVLAADGAKGTCPRTNPADRSWLCPTRTMFPVVAVRPKFCALIPVTPLA